MSESKNKNGVVFLVGGGPGDPELLTLKARRLLETADVVLYDFLAPPEILEYAPGSAELIYVGKQGGSHSLPQAQINALLVEKAKQGKRVVRLKGGDPFIFGRGGEEAETLADAGIPFELVPGISSAVAAPIYAGIPITHRRFGSSVTFISGHESPDAESMSTTWEKAAGEHNTLVILMGVKNIRAIMKKLVDCGMKRDTPAAVVRWGSRSDQKTATGTIADIADITERLELKPPAVIVVGHVIDIRDKMRWFDTKPLFGKRVLVARAKEQAGAMTSLLREAGAHVHEIPAIEIVPAIDDPEVQRALDRLAEFDWVLLTSANGVKYFFEAFYKRNLDARALAGKKIAAIGPATAKAVERYGIRVDLVPDEYKAEGLFEALGDAGIKGKKFLLARARVAREILPDTLREKGGEVVIAPIYDTILPERSREKLKRLLDKKEIDIAAFASSSTVENFVDMAGDADISGIEIACIGPITSKTAEKLGLKVSVQPQEYTIPAMVEAMVLFCTRRNQ